MDRPRPGRGRSLFEGFSADAPHITEVRRILQTLFRQHPTPDSRVLLVTSSSRGEGKSTISAHLALVAARVFSRATLLVDCDLHRPSLHRLLNLTRAPGLTELLRGAPLDSVVRQTTYPNLRVVLNGAAPDSVGDLYDDDRFASFVREARSKYDLVVLDVAPVLPTVEPLVMAEHVDGIILLALVGGTPITVLRRLKRVIAPVASKIVGVVLNNSLEALPYYYDYRYYGYRREHSTRIRKRETSNGHAGRRSTRPREEEDAKWHHKSE